MITHSPTARSSLTDHAADAAAKEGIQDPTEKSGKDAPYTHSYDNGSPFLTQDEAAAFLRLSPRTLERYRLAGKGPKFLATGRRRGRRLYRIDHLLEWADQRTFSSTSEVSEADA